MREPLTYATYASGAVRSRRLQGSYFPYIFPISPYISRLQGGTRAAPNPDPDPNPAPSPNPDPNPNPSPNPNSSPNPIPNPTSPQYLPYISHISPLGTLRVSARSSLLLDGATHISHPNPSPSSRTLALSPTPYALSPTP